MGALEVIKDKTLTFEQKVINLAKEAENSLSVLNYSDESVRLKEKGIICDLFEGAAPYRPRYILPDYEKFMKQGSEFLRLTPPTDIWDAVNNLLIFYKHVPSITTFPVWLGNLDALLEPFITDEKEAYQAIKFMLKHIDRTLTDSFVHANIGPQVTKAGRIILEVERELEDAIPNFTLKYDPNITPDDFAIEAIKTALKVAKPSFANHQMFMKDLGSEKYGIASCYNGLHVGGGGSTLIRLVLARLAEEADSIEDFKENVLPNAVQAMADLIDERIRFLFEESGFFESNFLVKEGLISRNHFTGMFGMVGLAECVNSLLNATNQVDRFGYGAKANQLGVEILEIMQAELGKRNNPYNAVTGGKHTMHAQVGIDTDFGISPGCRIPIGEEPELLQHIQQTSLYHKYFPSGIGDIVPFDKTANNNPAYVLDIIKGAFQTGMRYFSTYGDDCDVIRITGYLVKKSDMDKLTRGENVLNESVVLGLGAAQNSKILERKVRNV
ncbi:MAG: hypothetical protein K0R18_1457 [Bacillales bacterium]|jgi:YjjI family glycine radical enzyme|nr:hypothetical protein [Bacillales bacterium]